VLTVTSHGASKLDIALSGKLGTEKMKTALDELVSKSAKIEHGTILYDVIDFHIPSLGAIAVEFSRLPSMFALINKFDRAAVLADKAWLKKICELEGLLYPGLEIKAFNRDQRAEAEDWLSSLSKEG